MKFFSKNALGKVKTVISHFIEEMMDMTSGSLFCEAKIESIIIFLQSVSNFPPTHV